MDFFYAATGGFKVFGTAGVSAEYFYYVRFAAGAKAYDRREATRGRLESIVIKRYRIMYNPYDVLYTDTLNSLWNEDQLCSHGEAVDLAMAYYARREAAAEALLGS